jgi:hypothetical protein
MEGAVIILYSERAKSFIRDDDDDDDDDDDENFGFYQRLGSYNDMASSASL